MKEIIYYQTIDNKIPYFEWYCSLDKSLGLLLINDYQKLNEVCMVIIDDFLKNFTNLNSTMV